MVLLLHLVLTGVSHAAVLSVRPRGVTSSRSLLGTSPSDKIVRVPKEGKQKHTGLVRMSCLLCSIGQSEPRGQLRLGGAPSFGVLLPPRRKAHHTCTWRGRLVGHLP